MEQVVIENPAPHGTIFDSHAHYDDSRFNDCRDELLSSLDSLGVCGVINCAVDEKSSKRICEISKKYDFCYSAIGFHPENLPESEPDLSLIEKFFNDEKTVAVGEIGLDYYWTKDNIELQKKWFCAQADFANQISLPVVVHDREAHADTLNILKDIKPRGVLHCFSGSAETAMEILKLGMYIGVGGVSTFKNAKNARNVIESVPLERILLETDAPYLAPEPYRGKTCHSGMIIRVAEVIAKIKNISIETVLNTTKQNALDLFNI